MAAPVLPEIALVVLEVLIAVRGLRIHLVVVPAAAGTGAAIKVILVAKRLLSHCTRRPVKAVIAIDIRALVEVLR